MPEPISILMVIDEQGLAQTLTRALDLAGAGRYAVGVCPCAQTALATVAARRAIVLVDLDLPGLDATAFLRQVREASPMARLILMTAGGPQRLESLAGPPAEGYLLKPFGLADFLDVVERLARDAAQDECA